MKFVPLMDGIGKAYANELAEMERSLRDLFIYGHSATRVALTEEGDLSCERVDLYELINEEAHG